MSVELHVSMVQAAEALVVSCTGVSGELLFDPISLSPAETLATLRNQVLGRLLMYDVDLEIVLLNASTACVLAAPADSQETDVLLATLL